MCMRALDREVLPSTCAANHGGLARESAAHALPKWMDDAETTG